MRKASMTMKKCILIVLFVLLLAIPCKATEIDEEIISSLDSEFTDFYNSLPPDIQEYFKNQNSNTDFENLINQFDEKSILNFVASYVTSGLNEVLKCF